MLVTAAIRALTKSCFDHEGNLIQCVLFCSVQKMNFRNESCLSWLPMTYLTCLIDIWEEWIGLDNLEDYLNYVDYLIWVFTPLIIVFILPFLIVVFLYLSILFLHVYKRKNELKEAYSNSLWNGARKTLATLWDGHAAIWHGYEIYGLEKIPDEGPALIVYYHGAIPVDYYYFLAKLIIHKGRICHSVGDHFLFKVPGFKPLLEVFSVMHGPKEECVKALRNGHLLAISPGGVREALFSDETYTIMWGNRTGFAQVAIDAEVPVIPMFTQNIREGFRTLGGIRVFRWLYEKCRLPLVPVYGGFPVKFRTYLGDPIPYVPGITAAELAEKICPISLDFFSPRIRQSLQSNH
uniref:Transmembrane protein 68 isoform X3 n=1 Tax=Geotrypetes seraphini TaxID=260995 RepID=A0A6P8Q008_GEOSA|nr:transmembrane protein 68 isoform X3 [Geotrypetes seraphini]